MHLARTGRATALAMMFARAACAQTSGCESFATMDEVMPFALTTLNVPGISLQLTKSGLVRYEKAFGAYTVGEVVPIASGSKWLSAACILAVVDQGKLSLEDKISRYLPAATG